MFIPAFIIICINSYHFFPRASAHPQQTQQPLGAPDPQPQQQQRQRGGNDVPTKAEGAGGQRETEDASRLQCVHGQVCAPGRPKPPQEPCAECRKQSHSWEEGKAARPGAFLLLSSPLCVRDSHQALPVSGFEDMVMEGHVFSLALGGRKN